MRGRKLSGWLSPIECTLVWWSLKDGINETKHWTFDDNDDGAGENDDVVVVVAYMYVICYILCLFTEHQADAMEELMDIIIRDGQGVFIEADKWNESLEMLDCMESKRKAKCMLCL